MIWLPKPVYELLPYSYLAAGVAALAASMYLNFWYWPTICLVVGFVCLILGLGVLLKRRDYRHSRSPGT